jgi:hypothetical protein
MLKKTMLFAAVLTLSSLVFAQARTQREAAAAPAPGIDASNTCAFAYSSGSGNTFTQYCLSTNGNIVQFSSPSGYEFIHAGQVGEGYSICDFTPPTPVPYFDYAYLVSNNWGPTTVTTPSATAKKFVRATSDGIWQLTQTITQVKASAKAIGSAKVVMALKNLTGISRTVYFIRYADIDANSSGDNNFNWTFNSAFGAAPGFGYGLGLTNNTFSIAHAGFTLNTFAAPDPCALGANENNQPFTGDGSIGMSYAVVIPAGATKTVTMTYKPM